ncbi:MAG: DUF502 domain-containing protein [Deltaproteobacteria bacterium]|nr:DUF502 domain-containing protein [Deltaproteobacteria bacterium]
MTRIVRWFVQGLIFCVPIALTVWIVLGTFRTIDGWIGLDIPGIGVAIVLVGITVVGILATNFLTKRLMGLFESTLDRLPFVRLLHTSVKDLMSAFVGEKKRMGRPVLVDLVPGGAVKAMGFITRDDVSHYGAGDGVAVYFPQAYNFAGQVVIVPKASITPIALDSSEVMAFIVSGGVAGK